MNAPEAEGGHREMGRPNPPRFLLSYSYMKLPTAYQQNKQKYSELDGLYDSSEYNIIQLYKLSSIQFCLGHEVKRICLSSFFHSKG